MSDEIKPGTTTPTIRVGSTSASPRFYVNNAQVTASAWDVTLYFGEVIPQLGVEGDLEVVSRTVVVMSPEHAKAFLKALETTLTQRDEALRLANAEKQ
jgi:Protein of unknown function (DUF3467)